MFLYFAYGSNMSGRQMTERCPDHERLGIAVLKDHALCVPRTSPIRNCGVAGLAVTPGAEVWGVVYRLHDEDLAALDRREGYDPAKPHHENRYNRQTIRVLMDGRDVECLTYFARPEPGEHVPSANYLATMIEGAVENDLPAEYVATLRLIPSL
ncbi:gamma-glutamylcyclotransferase family protein [Aestuariivirga sp.]|uniref:gamma-glutamylcyclotransferase family protein n=1 Tax=Aestuariivirga sp. TaxID=2650926 RepID=UPI0025B8A25A|nr:gamma-glutamylcyclotransferase family protein [Aestuariivirga sp.]MCA3555901.1 gamma-glutamylcyclotransferase [Aestuariivirga sp.]